MKDKLRDAFGQVNAESGLKDKTREYIFEKTNGYRRPKLINYKRFAAAFACMALFLLGGHWLYFTPTVAISIDVNPSVELGVNRFDRVISFAGYNEDGRELTNTLDIKFLNYSEAVNQIIESEAIVSLLSNDEEVMIAVIGKENVQSEKILSDIESCMAGRKNTHCYYAHSEEVEMAHEEELSYGKYKAYLELQKLDPDITTDKIRNMTMREIREQISELSNDGESGASQSEKEGGHGGNGKTGRREENGYQGNGKTGHREENGYQGDGKASHRDENVHRGNGSGQKESGQQGSGSVRKGNGKRNR